MSYVKPNIMSNIKFKILVGAAKEVEKELNEIQEETNSVCIMGLSATNETTTVIIQLVE